MAKKKPSKKPEKKELRFSVKGVSLLRRRWKRRESSLFHLTKIVVPLQKLELLDVTAIAQEIKKAFAENLGKVQLDSYFDFWFGDAISCARKAAEVRRHGGSLLSLRP